MISAEELTSLVGLAVGLLLNSIFVLDAAILSFSSPLLPGFPAYGVLPLQNPFNCYAILGKPCTGHT